MFSPTSSILSQESRLRPASRIDYLTGVRGLASFYILVTHLHGFALNALEAAPHTPENVRLRVLGRFLNFTVLDYAHYAVGMFIVLSGYCLMLPIARSPERVPRGGAAAFLVRRAWRLLPNYYAALVICLCLIPVLPPAAPLTKGAVLSHLFLVENLHPAWKYAIDPPMWTMGIMIQIYPIFIFALLPTLRRFGRIATVALAAALSFLPRYLLPASYNLEWTYPWYILLFAFGMIATDVQFGTGGDPGKDRFPWGRAALALSLATVALRLCQRAAWAEVHALHYLRTETWGSGWPLDVLGGLAAVCVLGYLTATLRDPAAPKAAKAVVRAFERPVLKAVGDMSFSLYLIHYPIAIRLASVLRAVGLRPAGQALAEYAIGVPVCLAGAWLLHLAAERPSRKRVAPPSAAAAPQSSTALAGAREALALS